MSKRVLNFRILIHQDEDGVFVASAPSIPGCHTQGGTYEEAIKNIKEAIELCLEVAKKDSKYRKKVDVTQGVENNFIGIANVPVRVSAFPA